MRRLLNTRLLRCGLLDNGYIELPITSAHAVAVDGLPAIHKDPFDRAVGFAIRLCWK